MIYIGIRTRIGPSRSDALIVYLFDDTTIDTSLLQGGNYDAAQYLIFSDSQRVLLEFGESYCETDLLLDTVSQHWSNDGFSFIDNIDSTTFIVSAHRDASTAFTYLIALPLNRAADGLQNFYSMLIRILLVIVFVLLIAIGLLIYINYRPISALMRKLNKNQKNVGEFEAISDEINRMTDEISEKNMVILDSLLGNILYGIPLSEDMIKRINIPEDANCFFVFTLSGDIDTTQRTEITAQLLQRFSTKVLITDILFQELTVLICMAQTDCQQEIFDFITDYLQISSDAESTLHRGETVFSINEIKHSFESNFPPAPADEAGSAPEPVAKTVFQDPTSQLMYQIVEYLDGRFTDPLLSQSSVADHFQISTYSLSRLFKSKAGINFTEYVTNKRIQLAQELLRKKDSSIPAIAEQVGIPNVNYFYKVFKTVTGTSPAKYQNHIEN